MKAPRALIEPQPKLPIDGPRMRARRLKLGMSQWQLAMCLGTTLNTIARQERREIGIEHPDFVHHRITAIEAAQRASGGEGRLFSEGGELMLESLFAQVKLDGEALQKRRETLGLTRTQMADELGVATSTLIRWEDGSITIAHRGWLDWQLTKIETAHAAA